MREEFKKSTSLLSYLYRPKTYNPLPSATLRQNSAGCVQWMTAGKGLVHDEVSPDEFKRRGVELEILQLWLNLPSKYKFIEPSMLAFKKLK